MNTDAQGNTVSGADEKSIHAFDQALRAFNIYRGDPVAIIDDAIAAAPSFTMAHVLKAYLFALATEPGADRDNALARLTASLRESAAGDSENAHWAGAVALPAVDGFTAFRRGDYSQAIELLHGVRYIANQFGGSHAQRDIIDWTLTEAALRAGNADIAAAMANERLALKPHSPGDGQGLSLVSFTNYIDADAQPIGVGVHECGAGSCPDTSQYGINCGDPLARPDEPQTRTIAAVPSGTMYEASFTFSADSDAGIVTRGEMTFTEL
ncbi:MAG: hypothetical protein U5R46_01540 [Gammaproteobacteria bacterium]|nr:hypothetical protein [Gammaproteobacteria bacterium]